MAKKYQLHGAFPSKAGDSAYQIAQKNGFEGTEQEWLASLVGPQGPQGIAGNDELVVHVTQSGTTLIADKTFENIQTAYQAGQDVRCVFMSIVLSLVRAADDVCTFSCVYNSQVFTITISTDGTVVATNVPLADSNDSVSAEFPTLAVSSLWRGQTDHTTVTEIRFVEDYNPTAYDETWDAGDEAGSITAYREGNVITVSANGKSKIMMNARSAAMFAYFYKLKTIRGLEMLDASEVTILAGMFAYCEELTSVDMSSWYCDKVTSLNGMFQYCYDLRSVKMPHGLNSETLTNTTSVFEDCHKLVDVDMGNGPTSIGDKMFAKCINLERVVGLGAATTVGVRAFIYCAKLKDIDLNPAILTNIGESAFRLSSVEDCINMDDLNQACTVDMLATRSKRWNASALAGVQDRTIPTVLLEVPHADNQTKYPDVKFGHKNVPWDDTEDPVDVHIAEGGCSAFCLYHEWQCIYRGTDLEKDNFLHYWETFEGDNFVNRNDDTMVDYFAEQATILGWDHTETFITSAEQLDVVIDRLNRRLPTGAIMYSSNISGSHAVLIIGGDTLSGKLAILDPAASDDQAEIVWVKFEDIFTSGNDADRLIIHTYGDAYEGYVPAEYIPVPDTAAVGQTLAVKSVDETGKPIQWETADLPSGGSAVAFPATPQFDVTVEEDVTVLLYNTLDGVSLADYGFTKLYTIVQTTAQSDATSGEFFLCVNATKSDMTVEHPRASAGASFMGQTAARCWHAYYDLTIGTVQFSPSGNTNMTWNVAVNTVTDVSKLFGKTITNFKFVRNAGILAGTTIKVWLA